MTEPLEFSRILKTAATLGDDATDPHRFVDKRVLLTGEADLLQTRTGRDSFLAALHLLPRICADVTIEVPDGPLAREAEAIARRIAFRKPIGFAPFGTGTRTYDAIVRVGVQAPAGEPCTVFHSEGWLARISSTERPLPKPTDRPNPMASLAAASLAVSETFKRLLHVNVEKFPLFDALTWNLLSYAVGDERPGPDLPAALPVDLLVGGVGAIGNGIVYLLGELPIQGRVLAVDAQTFAEENLGTCMLIGPTDRGRPKAVLAERLRSKSLTTEWFHEPIEAFAARLGKDLPYPSTILGGLDNIPARHGLQDLWPDLYIDGAISPLMCQATRHPFAGTRGCARCFFAEPTGESAVTRASRATGLTLNRATQQDTVVLQADVAAAPPEKRAWLAERVGKQICSIVPAAIARERSERAPQSFEPSAPFVATLSASMVVAELVKATLGLEKETTEYFQFDALQGPTAGLTFPQPKKPDCRCQTRRSSMERWRATRNG